MAELDIVKIVELARRGITLEKVIRYLVFLRDLETDKERQMTWNALIGYIQGEVKKAIDTALYEMATVARQRYLEEVRKKEEEEKTSEKEESKATSQGAEKPVEEEEVKPEGAEGSQS